MAAILVVDDERSMREFLEIFLLKRGHEVTVAESAEAAFDRMTKTEFDLVLTDLRMPGKGGLEVLRETKRLWPDTQVIVMTAYSTTETAIEAMRDGAYDYLGKPFKINEVGVVVDKALEKRQLLVTNQRLNRAVKKQFAVESIVGTSASMRGVFETIRKVASTRAGVLIMGESGTGKELIARALHYNSNRSDNPLVVVNCGAIPDALMESELFGHMKGSFTGAGADKRGLFEEAEGGTLFLDEIGEMSVHLQVKLLRALQERRIKRVGGNKEIALDVRIVAATNKDLEEEVKNGNFREDLYFRLNIIQINIPPLRERKDDIPLLAHYFLQKYGEEMGRRFHGFTSEAMAMLEAYDYPGNIRELENIIQRCVTFESTDWITVSSIPERVAGATQGSISSDAALALGAPASFSEERNLDHFIEDLERQFLLSALTETHGNVTEAARKLGISFRSMRYKLSKHGIRKDLI